MTRVLVCGGRTFDDRPMLFRVLDDLHEQYCFSVLIHGMAPGVDRLADHWAVLNRIPPYRFHAAWKEQGNAAGPIRNGRMLVKGKPDLVVSFPGKNGTADMIRQTLKARIKLLKVRADGTVEEWIDKSEQSEMNL